MKTKSGPEQKDPIAPTSVASAQDLPYLDNVYVGWQLTEELGLVVVKVLVEDVDDLAVETGVDTNAAGVLLYLGIGILSKIYEITCRYTRVLCPCGSLSCLTHRDYLLEADVIVDEERFPPLHPDHGLFDLSGARTVVICRGARGDDGRIL